MPDQAVVAGHRLSGDSQTDHNIRLACQSVEQGLQPSHQQNHQGGTLLSGKALELLMECRIQVL